MPVEKANESEHPVEYLKPKDAVEPGMRRRGGRRWSTKEDRS